MIFTVVILVCTAICGIDQVIAVRQGWSLLGQWPNTLSAHLLGLFDLISLTAISLSALGLITSAVTWPVVTFLRRNLKARQQQPASTVGSNPIEPREEQ